MAKPRTRDWVIFDGRVICYRSPIDGQSQPAFAVATKLTPFHDNTLAQATKEINAVLIKVQRANKDSKRKLAIIQTHKGPMLAWTEYGAVGPYDEDAEVEQALGLK